MDTTLVVYGDRSGPVVLADPVARAFFEPRGDVIRLVHPTLEEVLEPLREVQRFWFWGHGNHGGLWIRKGEFLSLDDVAMVADQRQASGAGRMELATLRACHTLSTIEAEQAWLALARQVQGFPGVTMEYWGKIHPILTLESAEDLDP